VPSKIALAAGLLWALACLWGVGVAAAEPRVVLALLPNGTSVKDLEATPGISPGLLSAGLGEVSPDQTYLDITQGNRVFDSLYDADLPIVDTLGRHVPQWARIVARARSAPADIIPGLLATALDHGGVRHFDGPVMAAARDLTLPALLAADMRGYVGRIPGCRGYYPCLPTVGVVNATPGQLPSIVRTLRGRDLLIALERPPPGDRRQLAVGIAGAGFDGNLTSDSTRIDGYVTSTDLAPTILDRLGLAIPSQMTGTPIRAEGSPDFGEVESLGERLAEIAPRRGSVVGISLLAWILAAGLAAALFRGRVARVALRLLALSVAYLPLLLLIGAALSPGTGAERLLLVLGAPALAALTLAAFRGYRALAVTCALTTAATAIDVIAGSPLTSLSLIGPNPGGGVRFYGIGNELEAILGPLIIVGTGAAIAGFAAGASRRGAAIAFLTVGVLFAFVFAAGRFGADVGAAIVLPAGAAVAAAVITRRRALALLALAAPLLALAALALVDLVSGGDAHLTRSVLDAGGLHALGDVVERRLRLSAISFGRAAPVLPAVLIAIVVAVLNRRRIRSWLDGFPAMLAAFAGATAATVVGTLANDSGALLLEVGAAYLLVFLGYAWAERGMNPPGTGNRSR
jgi:hypothetical protein